MKRCPSCGRYMTFVGFIPIASGWKASWKCVCGYNTGMEKGKILTSNCVPILLTGMEDIKHGVW